MFSQSSNYFKYFLELLNADPTDGIDNLNHMEFMNHYMESLWKLFSVENELCSQDPYAYNSCSKYDEFLLPHNQIANSRQGEDSFSFTDSTCRTAC